MIEHARELSRKGRAVYIVAAYCRDAERIRREIGDGPHGIKVETEASLSNLDWSSLTLRGAHPNCAVLVDHRLIEVKFSKAFEMMTRYDKPMNEQGKMEDVPDSPNEP